MIRGEIILHKEPSFRHTNPHYQGDWSALEEYYGDWSTRPLRSQSEILEEIEKEVEKAMNLGYYIGRKVRRTKGYNTGQTGVIKYFVRSTTARDEVNDKHQVLAVLWPDWSRPSNYSIDELELVPEEGEDTPTLSLTAADFIGVNQDASC